MASFKLAQLHGERERTIGLWVRHVSSVVFSNNLTKVLSIVIKLANIPAMKQQNPSPAADYTIIGSSFLTIIACVLNICLILSYILEHQQLEMYNDAKYYISTLTRNLS